MNHQEGTSNIPTGPAATRGARSFHKAANPSADFSGFSHGAYTSNHRSIPSYSDRHPRKANIPSINTASQARSGNANDMGTPATGFDMQFTPLLPSQLLIGSPFQPGTPAAFASPQFSNFASFGHQQNASQPQGPQSQMNNQHGQAAPMSPQMYQSMLSSNGGYGGSQVFSPQSPSNVYATFQQPGSAQQMQAAPGMMTGTSRTVYLGNIPPETPADEILSHVRSGQIESVRLLPDKNCAFISFLDGSSATHFHSDAILKKLSIRGQDIKIGWGKPSQVPTSVALAVQQSGASRNVYLGSLPDEVTEEELREDLGKFGPIDTVKLVREKAIGFVHFLSIGNAVKAVSQLSQEPKWQSPRRVYYGKDRCAYVSKTQQQNAAQYLGIAPGYAHVLNSADRDLISNALAQQSVAAAAVATTAGGVNNLGNRTVYLGNIHPETTIEEICNVVRGGLLHHIRYIPDKHICFVTFIDPTSAASFFALSNIQGLMIHNRRLKIGWGKHSGALPPAIALAVSGGASRNVYIGNLDESWTEERLRQDFSEYGDIELVNALREKSCAFVNFTNIANAIKAIEAVRGREEYRRFKINFGKDRCGNAPRQVGNHQHQQQGRVSTPNGTGDGHASPQPMAGGLQPNPSQGGSATSPTGSALSPTPASIGPASSNGQTNQHGPTPSTIVNSGSNNPLTMYLNQVSNQQQQPTQQSSQASHQSPFSVNSLQHQHQHMFSAQQAALYGGAGGDLVGGAALDVVQHPQSQGNPSYSMQSNDYGSGYNANSSAGQGLGGLLAPSNANLNAARAQHSRAVSLPAFPGQSQQGNAGHGGMMNQGAFGGLGNGGYGLAIQGDGGLHGWAEEEVGAQ
ncbi:MAG: hypothetical protein M4579_003911 [Chaenotheca gracillima]|nr:MAG: hypothetical protein M4579_003911 [Chaenotheca gracillima]